MSLESSKEKKHNGNGRRDRRAINLDPESAEILEKAAKKYHTKKTWLIIALLKDYDQKKMKRSDGNLEYGQDFW